VRLARPHHPYRNPFPLRRPVLVCDECFAEFFRPAARSEGITEEDISRGRRAADEQILNQDARLPRAILTHDGMRVSLERWLTRNYPISDSWLWLAGSWPLPVGSEALAHWATVRGENVDEGSKPRTEELPGISEDFPPDTYFGLAVKRRCEHGSVWLFGVVHTLGHVDGNLWTFGDPAIRMTQWSYRTTALSPLVSGLRNWYGRVRTAMEPPPVPGLASFPDRRDFEQRVRRAVRNVCNRTGKAVASQIEVADALGLSRQSFNRLAVHHGLAWHSLKRPAED